ncbi:hypothetical protein I4I73_29705 [Pseudonocardia sp. KRD-184]|uniref:Uncharacterized protein n=1 Tax=Pseudonocardia oceani TaxID=2792013 RepID=A0ABS6UDS3_9PSEU|nr:hypothetical protein [Pseudonocardia oceani]MBW0093463.1 hypothetical protein [Pseudonocardia oceani]MBW0100160.1 hypothetical protein [Pseudonocardia oceani]MBW0112858.1 hypothetical protein [Pseudonocardia oceani]MBW0125807.1 hypothetical protein [Pseudonocardia oceani]MBW0130405.1 hypothetical protein [Pseudonocardia oceani]
MVDKTVRCSGAVRDLEPARVPEWHGGLMWSGGADHVERPDTAHIPQLTDAAGPAAALARAGAR